MPVRCLQSLQEPAQCALESSGALQDRPHLRLRMGIHSGTVSQVVDVDDQMNVAGAGMNVAQRVLDCADAGHILLSKHLADDLQHYRHWQPYLHDLGECEVKHGLRLHVFNLCKDNFGNPHLPDKLKRAKRWKPSAGAGVRPVPPPRFLRSALITAVVLAAIALAFSFFVLRRKSSSGVARAVPESPS